MRLYIPNGSAAPGRFISPRHRCRGGKIPQITATSKTSNLTLQHMLYPKNALMKQRGACTAVKTPRNTGTNKANRTFNQRLRKIRIKERGFAKLPTIPSPFVRTIGRLLPFAQLFIKLQPQAAVVFDDMAHFFDALQVHFQFLRRNIETNVVACLYQKTLQARQREDIFDMVIV